MKVIPETCRVHYMSYLRFWVGFFFAQLDIRK
jgi:hypothetical protein